MKINEMSIEDVMAENERRNTLLQTRYDPLTGEGACGERRLTESRWEKGAVWLPVTMLEDPEWKKLRSAVGFRRLRARHDFEYWCASCVKIRHKLTGKRVAFTLNAPQRRVAALIEEQRVAGKPLRLILLKARQWGGSTLVQMYFAWVQAMHRTDWHSLVCAHVKAAAANIRRMYRTMLEDYPREMWIGKDKAGSEPKFLAVKGAADSLELNGRGSMVTVTSSFGQEATRGLDCAMVHLSEVAFWKDSEQMHPEDLVRAVCSGVPLQPYTFIAMESTANGVGSFFHRRWTEAKDPDSEWIAAFVPWYEIEMYRLPVKNPRLLIAKLNDYERSLWERGLTLEMIHWYHRKRRDTSDEAMLSEFPTDDSEAFVNTGAGVFARDKVERLRLNCVAPLMRGEVRGLSDAGRPALEGVHFTADACGKLEVWTEPAQGIDTHLWRYVAAVDVGGRSAKADYSVVAVFDRYPAGGGGPEVVAQWRGHCDHDTLAWKAAAIARWYRNALLVVESNTLESSGGSSQYILETLNGVYPHMYVRRHRDRLRPGSVEQTVGFHTNVQTKGLIITNLIAMVREGSYTERDSRACDEMAVYEQGRSGSYAARPGCHDDILMTRAIGLYVIATMPPTELPV